MKLFALIILLTLLPLVLWGLRKILKIPNGSCKVCQGLGILDNFLTCDRCKGTGEDEIL